jgi:hypothetical protein
MSFMDKIKAMFSGGSDADDRTAPSAARDDDLAIEDVPPAPVDPLGTSMPGVPPAAPPPPADRDEQP